MCQRETGEEAKESGRETDGPENNIIIWKDKNTVQKEILKMNIPTKITVEKLKKKDLFWENERTKAIKS